MSRKTFKRGEAVLVQRDAGHFVNPDKLEPATYIEPISDMRGWHRVEYDAQSPPRCIDSMHGMEVSTEAAQDPTRSQRVYRTHRDIVPSRRIRKRSP